MISNIIKCFNIVGFTWVIRDIHSIGISVINDSILLDSNDWNYESIHYTIFNEIDKIFSLQITNIDIMIIAHKCRSPS